jgi:hypothetical protein
VRSESENLGGRKRAGYFSPLGFAGESGDVVFKLYRPDSTRDFDFGLELNSRWYPDLGRLGKSVLGGALAVAEWRLKKSRP